MIRIIYLIILAYFILGGIGFFIINRKREPDIARRNWIKYITYCLIIHIVFFSIVINQVVFKYLAGIIIIMGIFELYTLFSNSGFANKRFFFYSLMIYTILAYGFVIFSSLEKGLILFSFLVVSVFDSFSQITGQLWGKRKIMPSVSPGKTIEGLIGGAVVAVLSSLLFKDLTTAGPPKIILISTGIVLFAFLGDIFASIYKRRYNVKDFNDILPGHGGFLDRFDSLIAGGAWIALCGIF